jgi:hypothetical protein
MKLRKLLRLLLLLLTSCVSPLPSRDDFCAEHCDTRGAEDGYLENGYCVCVGLDGG